MRSRRQIIPGVPYHVIQQGNNRRLLYSYPHEYQLYLKLLEDALQKFRVAMHVLTLMPTHNHMCATSGTETALSDLMKSVGQRYAQIRNERRGGSGKLFKERFTSRQIVDEQHLARCPAYIELNPVKDGLCKLPSEWKWSTYGLHIGKPELSAVPARIWTPLESLEDHREIRIRRAEQTRAT